MFLWSWGICRHTWQKQCLWLPEDMPEHMPEDMPGRMPEDVPDRMPEDMSDRMPEDLPVTNR